MNETWTGEEHLDYAPDDMPGSYRESLLSVLGHKLKEGEDVTEKDADILLTLALAEMCQYVTAGGE